MTYPNTELYIDGAWAPAASGATLPVENPATGEEIGRVAKVGRADLDRALAAAQKGFEAWRDVSPYERAKIMRKAGELIRERADAIARNLTLDQGKVLAEARIETLLAADILDWFAGEGQRAYGRLIPSRAPGITQTVVREPVGPVAAFTPWNFPINQVIRKVSGALAAGCSIIVKGPEETPSAPAAIVQALADAGLPPGVVNLVYGVPAEVSEYLIPNPIIRKVSFTGSVAVGKQLAALAGLHMKRVTMELGGHAPVIVCEDADIPAAVKTMVGSKFRNGGQVCISPTRFMIHDRVYDQFVEGLVAGAKAVKVGDGLAADSVMGPMVSEKRVRALESLLADAVAGGAVIETGGQRLGNRGSFFAPTILSHVTPHMRIMNEEPFGPVALVAPFSSLDEAIAEANRLPVGLGSYAFTRAARTVDELSRKLQVGMLTINHLGFGLPEVPFGGIGDSGYGTEGGAEAIEAYLTPKFVTHLAV